MNPVLKPHITEKAYRTISEDKKVASTYTFKVLAKARKEDIKQLVEKTYTVHVTDVRMIKNHGKVRRFKNILGHTSSFKKAIVRLKAGEVIKDFDVATSTPEDKE